VKRLGIKANAFEIITPTEEEIRRLDNLDSAYLAVLEMSKSEREFLTALICRSKPQKILEIGVSAGGSSVLIMGAATYNAELSVKLYSIDYASRYYRNTDLPVGYVVDRYPQFKANYHLYSGGMAYRFLDMIGGEIDFCLIDTAHQNPGEILDFLMVLPYLKENAIVVFHDTGMHTSMSSKLFFVRHFNHTTALLFSALRGKILAPKELLQNQERKDMYFPNIGAIAMDKTAQEHIFGIFNLLSIRWSYRPNAKEEGEIREFFARRYDRFFADFIVDIFAYHNLYFEELERRKPIIKKFLRKILPYSIKKSLAQIYNYLFSGRR
jgi:predicted O-methyltransferase YrrM